MMIRPYLPDPPITDTVPWQVILSFTVLLAAVLAAAICIARYAAGKFKCNKKWTVIGFAALSIVSAVAMFCFFGFSATTVKGIIMFLILLFASFSDIKKRECDDYIHPMLVVAAFIGTSLTSVPGMFLSAMVVVGIMIMALLLFDGEIGGADVKLAAACSFVLGLNRAFVGLAVGLTLAVFINLIKNRKKKEKHASFPLVPYLATGFMMAYFI